MPMSAYEIALHQSPGIEVSTALPSTNTFAGRQKHPREWVIPLEQCPRNQMPETHTERHDRGQDRTARPR